MKTTLIGQTFGRLTVTSFSSVKHGERHWECLCTCGKTHIARGSHLKSGGVTSCGCYRTEQIIKAKTTHGARTRLNKQPNEYYIWQGIKQRCHNPKNTMYKYYGQRGIAVCDRWFNSYENFISDMGPRPSLEYSIDRINNDGNYEPSNCRWATPLIQGNNKNLKTYTVLNMNLTITAWAKVLNISTNAIYKRIKKGQTMSVIVGDFLQKETP